jgi:hypothetical protein
LETAGGEGEKEDLWTNCDFHLFWKFVTMDKWFLVMNSSR